MPCGCLQNSVDLLLFYTGVKWKSGPQNWCSMHIVWRFLSGLLHVRYKIWDVHGLWVFLYSCLLILLITNCSDYNNVFEKCRLYKLKDLLQYSLSKMSALESEFSYEWYNQGVMLLCLTDDICSFFAYSSKDLNANLVNSVEKEESNSFFLLDSSP